MNKKRKKAECDAFFKQQKWIRVGYIKDHYPDIESIDFEFTYKDFDKVSPFDSQHCEHYVRNPKDSALFDFTCPNRECINGGHDITDIVDTAIKSHQSECSGEISCQGWSDQERVGKHKCLYKLIYKIAIKYKTAG